LIGFRDALADAGVLLDGERVVYSEYDVQDAIRISDRLLRGPRRPEAVFAGTDVQAIGVLKAAERLGIRVPDELAVVGFDNIDAAEYLELTTVSQCLDESGRIAAELLFSRMNDPGRAVQHAGPRLELIRRKTA
jgi:LacI family transcriptional regulator